MGWRGWRWLWPWHHNPRPAEDRDPGLRVVARTHERLAEEIARLRAVKAERDLYERRDRRDA